MRSGETTWRTFSSILASEAARGLAKERDNLNKANLEIERLEQRYRELEYRITNENSKLKIAQLESFIAEERGSKQELENSRL